MQGGRVVGQYVAEVNHGARRVSIVDCRAADATSVAAALQAQGLVVLPLDPTAGDALPRLRKIAGD